MSGLLLKDVLILKKYFRSLIFVIIIYGGFQIMSPESAWISSMLLFLGALSVQSTFSYDEMAKWDSYVLASPITRREVLQSKYAFAAISIVISFLIGCLSGLIFNVGIAHMAVKECLFISLTLFSVACIFVAFIVPLIIKFGSERARFFVIPIVMIPTIAIGLLAKTGFLKHMPKITDDMVETAIPFMVLFGILLFIASYFLSLSIYKKKEF